MIKQPKKVSNKIKKLLREEGMGRDQAVVVALNMAKGSKVKQKAGRKRKKPLTSY